jgi:hypothetical protein
MKTHPRHPPSEGTSRRPQACLAVALVGLAAITAFSSAQALPRHDGPDPHDARFHHDRDYPARGYRVAALPVGSMAARAAMPRDTHKEGLPMNTRFTTALRQPLTRRLAMATALAASGERRLPSP